MPTFGHSPLVDLGDKVVADIIAVAPWTPSGGGALTFTPRRVYYLTPYEPTDTALHVDVAVAELDSEELADRAGVTDRTYVVAIAVQEVLADKTDKAAVDALVNFVEALRGFYPLQSEFTVAGSQKARCVKRETVVTYSPEELAKDARFFSIVHLTFEGWF